MKKIILLIAIIAAFCNNSFSQTRYIIRLKDKGASPYSFSNPAAFLTNRALQRRTRYNIAIDSADLPVTPGYIDSIRLSGTVTILNTSKWLNQVAIQTTDAAALLKINAFPFVISESPIGARVQLTNMPINKKLDAPYNDALYNFSLTGKTTTQNATSDYYSYGQSLGQVHLHNGEFLHNRGFRGEGMQMAVTDAGFYHYLTLPTFDSIRNNNQVLGTWDFVTGNDSVDEDHPHGMYCLSTIAANMPGIFVGTAPATSFYLYRTEDAPTEYPIEEQNWAAGAERADSLGVDVCSVSLGYTTFDNSIYNHTYADMNGNTTLISNAAGIAAKKGMLIVVAAGNEGNGSWHYISAPADADSVMAIGAVNTSGFVGSFSSYGPSSDGQIKPGVAAVGVSAVVANTSNGQPTFGNGTSFACPNMAGLSTCLWQAFPEVNNMAIISTLQQSATRATNPDDRVGYGIPDMKKAFVLLIKQLYTKKAAVVANCKSTLEWTAKTDSVISIVLERKLLADADYVAVNTQHSTDAFAARDFTYTDDLASVSSAVIKYRLKMDIAADTSFYLDSMQINFAPKPNLGADKTIAKCSDSSVNLNSLYNITGLTALWTLNGTAVSNTNAAVTPGTYRLIVTNTTGCADTVLVTINNDVQLCLAVPPVVITEKITIPNPVNDNIIVKVENKDPVTIEIIVHNSFGQKIYQFTNHQTLNTQVYTIPFKEMVAGIYYVTIKTNGAKEVVKKIMKR
jgi:serine protease AprX